MSSPNDSLKIDSRKPRIAVYPGSFDLLTNGHLDIIQRSQKLFDRLVIGIGVNIQKQPMFTLQERLDVLREITASWDNIDVQPMEGLTIEFAVRHNAQFLIRGLRAVSDFEFELQLAIMNHQLNSEIETIFMAAEARNIFLSSRMVKDVWLHGGDVSDFVPPPVVRALEKKRMALRRPAEEM